MPTTPSEMECSKLDPAAGEEQHRRIEDLAQRLRDSADRRA